MPGSVCATCRSRKVKCDRAQPRCGACIRLNIECVTQLPHKLCWLHSWTAPSQAGLRVEVQSLSIPHSADNVSQRTPLFSESSRKADCLSLLSAISCDRIERVLERLDNDSRMIVTNQSLSEGPFAVFSYNAIPGPKDNVAQQIEGQSQADDLVPADCDFGLLDPSYDMVDDISMTPWLGHIHDIGDACEDVEPQETIVTSQTHNIDASPIQFDLQDMLYDNLPPLPSTFSPKQSLIALSHPDIQHFPLSTYQCLLKHYSSTMIKVLSYSQLEAISPWKVVFLPCILQTLGEITLFGSSTNHARMALLYFVLSTSAYNMENLGLDRVDLDHSRLGEVLQQHAKLHMQKCLQEINIHDDKSKYKEGLMALLSAFIMSVSSGQTDDARTYLLDIEKLIFLHGFDKRHNSRKIQILHGVYIHLRIFGETTSRSLESSSDDLDGATNNSSGSTESDSTTYRFPSAWPKGFDTSLPKQSESGSSSFESNMVGPIGGYFKPSILEQFYQIPETMLHMLSRTTQLANDDDTRTRNNDVFRRRVRELEDFICNYKNPVLQVAVMTPCDDQPVLITLSALSSDAVYNAILIYFYQRIHSLNILVLQPYVSKIVNSIFEIERLKLEYHDVSADMSWPTFIAGSAALGSDDRDQISSWLQRSAKRTGIQVYLTARDALLQFWNECDERNTSTTWMDFMQQRGLHLLLI